MDAKAALPKNIEYQDNGKSIQLAMNFPRAAGIIQLVVLGFFAFMIYNYLSQAGANDLAVQTEAVALLAFGGCITMYLSLVCLFNRRVITISKDHVEVAVGPVPFFSSKTVSSADIRQILVKRVQNKSTVSYKVTADMRDGRHITLIRSLRERDQAQFIEMAIEDYLGIADSSDN